MGLKRAVLLLACSLAAADFWIVALVVQRMLSPWTLLVFGSVWPSIAALRVFRAGGKPAQMMPG